MRRSCRATLAILGFALLTGAAAPDSTKQLVLILPSDIALHTVPDTTMGPYYTVSYSPPESLTTVSLDRAILEVYLEVGAKARGEYVNEAPLFEIYALKEPFRSSVDPEALDRTTRAARPIANASERRVLVDITAIVRAHLQGSIENNGLVIGSLTGMREGEFVVLAGRLPHGAVGRLYFHRRHGLSPTTADAKRRSN